VWGKSGKHAGPKDGWAVQKLTIRKDGKCTIKGSTMHARAKEWHFHRTKEGQHPPAHELLEAAQPEAHRGTQ
jgi:hypothetical protein